MRLKTCGQRTFHLRHQPTQPATQSPFGQLILAWANGQFIFSPINSIPVKRKQPRTHFVTLA